MRTILWIFVLSMSLYAECVDKKISLTSNAETSIYDLLFQLGRQCGLSIVIKDKFSQEKLESEKPFLHIKQQPLQSVLHLLIAENGFFYEFNQNILKVSSHQTRTFKINYIATDRSSVSSTEVSISRNDDNMNYTNTLQGNIFEKSGGSRSGVNITAEDNFKFWEQIEREIFSILHRPGDTMLPVQDENVSQVVINKPAGLITITGNKSQMERVETYIQKLQKHLSFQVMIDVSILNVRHNNSHTIGVDWNQLYNLQNILITSQAKDNDIPQVNNKINYSVNIFPYDTTLNRVVEFLDSYGNVRTLSNPKLLTLNNQPAMISVGDVIRYRKSTVFQSSHSSSMTNTNTDTEYPSVFAGVLLDITPAIFEKEIMLKINPSITRLKGKDVENAAQALDSPPNLSANQLSSIVKVKDGEKVIIGGLISKSNQLEQNSIPILGSIPLLKYLFSYEKMVEITEEMVIVITPRILSIQPISAEDLNYTHKEE
ncbi:pilus (MSHA type) biogenesis protein MshL [Helicobacter monodelphidis]|uniref:pilus (MSHA type) biogenesis protein MshL n=1 Tax=Helicobacter sp. 15-1451 TaxID=2004995 RepID=UPI000DCB16AF|nr:pilus (MSHA type) biogenesis protein MshL [Helicobacter sp. 15-1451]RAX56849.1 pilus (MSHA type) biogenesis protein MshL [Helicobacter sp. 15-1451]